MLPNGEGEGQVPRRSSAAASTNVRDCVVLECRCLWAPLDHVRTLHNHSPLPEHFHEKQLTEGLRGADGQQHASARR